MDTASWPSTPAVGESSISSPYFRAMERSTADVRPPRPPMERRRSRSASPHTSPRRESEPSASQGCVSASDT
eukprot:scaffold320213_cov27-Tisochrysis_lutea.AAC.1